MRPFITLTAFVLFFFYSNAQTNYTFTGSGNWSDSTNWLNKLVPPIVVPAGDTIFISPITNGLCILNISQIIEPNAILIVLPNKNFIVNQSLLVINSAILSQSDTLSKEIVSMLDTIGSENPSLNQIVGYDGDNLSSSRFRTSANTEIIKNKIDSMLVYAQMLSGQKTHLYPSDGVDKPAHMGLVYSYGQRNLSVRLKPNCKSTAIPQQEVYCDEYHEKYQVYGLDCSGLIYNLLKYVGVEISPISVGTFYDNFNARMYYKGLRLINMKKLPVEQIRSGDFIKWRGHIGMVCDLGSLGKIVFQSNGTEEPGSEQEQNKNLGPGRGVHPLKLQGMINEPVWGANYEILRLSETFMDPRDREVYTIKRIGSQMWMTQNLNYAAPSSFCYGYASINCVIYGRLYDWSTALSAPPPGWHLPSDNEWQMLINYLGGDAVAGGKMKLYEMWSSPNVGATNSSGFNALPGGYRGLNGVTFYSLNEHANWWSSTDYSSTGAWNRWLINNATNVNHGTGNKADAIAIRCIKDE